MYFKQIVKEDLGCASYIVGCTSAGVCAVVDPRLDMVEEILTLSRDEGLEDRGGNRDAQSCRSCLRSWRHRAARGSGHLCA